MSKIVAADEASIAEAANKIPRSWLQLKKSCQETVEEQTAEKKLPVL